MVGQKIEVSLCEINDYKILEKTEKYKRDLRPSKPDSLTHELESRLRKVCRVQM